MTEREALLWLATPEPEPFHQVRSKLADTKRWDHWRRKTTEALHVAQRVGAPLDLGVPGPHDDEAVLLIPGFGGSL
jgi:hypothetical protein